MKRYKTRIATSAKLVCSIVVLGVATRGAAQTSQPAHSPVSVVLSNSAPTVKLGTDWKLEGAINNLTDNTVSFSFAPEVYMEDVRDSENKSVPKVDHGRAHSYQVLLIAPHDSWPIKLLLKDFDLNKPGKYTAQVTVVVNGNTTVRSNLLALIVVP
jgi:hypothetical protein